MAQHEIIWGRLAWPESEIRPSLKFWPIEPRHGPNIWVRLGSARPNKIHIV
jgi:hypothetical protein